MGLPIRRSITLASRKNIAPICLCSSTSDASQLVYVHGKHEALLRLPAGYASVLLLIWRVVQVRVRKFISDDSIAFPMPEPDFQNFKDQLKDIKDQLKDKLEADDITILPDEANQSPPTPQVKFPAPHVRFPAPAT